jgi:uncharacterized protein (TIGR02757 family)
MPSLKHHLDAFLADFRKEEHLSNDPVQFVHRYDDPRDRETAGLIASALAYGNVKSVLASVDRALKVLGPRPAEAVAAFEPRRDARRLAGLYHRFNTARDIGALFWTIGRAFEKFGSIENAFLNGLAKDAADTGPAIARFSGMFLGFGPERFYSRREWRTRLGVRYFFPSPEQGSACKRINLFLRWMARPADGIDCGVWPGLDPRLLVIPLDTHIARIGRYIGLTDRSATGWRTALDVTHSLRRLDAADPLRYDFALCHLGIAGDCPRKRDPVKCLRCPIQTVCRL